MPRRSAWFEPPGILAANHSFIATALSHPGAQMITQNCSLQPRSSASIKLPLDLKIGTYSVAGRLIIIKSVPPPFRSKRFISRQHHKPAYLF
ncbi:hypothetical protein BaRGS_00000486 [Batillaria attramentaria]|uniref:Uncharacterized protein n=1 Tax=Batillaria attramentaria TaxID=370345 RepID=A0ABD0M940_9CAEN